MASFKRRSRRGRRGRRYRRIYSVRMSRGGIRL